MEETQIIKLSVKECIQSALIAAGWTNAADWVRLARIQPTTSPPAVGIVCGEIHRTTFEVGGSKRSVRAYIDIEIRGRNEPELDDIKDTIEKNVDNMPIIDFNIAMPPDPTYDAEAQEIARGLVGENIRGRVVDAMEGRASISFELDTDKPI